MNSNSAPPASPGEALWRNIFFYMSALMGALALVDFNAGRFAHGLGDAGVACLMVSLMTQFPFVRAIVSAGSSEKSREEVLREAERIRTSNPWADRLGSTGWLLLLASLVLRAFGMQ